MAAPQTATAPSGSTEMPRLKRRFNDEIRARLQEELGLANTMQVPRFEKIVVNVGVGRATQQPSLLEGAVRDLGIITGQKPLVTRAKTSIAGFKLREGQAIGAKVTLRNYTFGITEQLIFPEIDYDKVDAPRGMDITIVTTAPTNEEGRALLRAYGFPFRTGEDPAALGEAPRKKNRPANRRPGASGRRR
jgi:large subunit ribosomal protein L5